MELLALFILAGAAGCIEVVAKGWAKGHQVIKQGISSQVIEPVSLYLGIGKGALAEFMDLGVVSRDKRSRRRCGVAQIWIGINTRSVRTGTPGQIGVGRNILDSAADPATEVPLVHPIAQPIDIRFVGFPFA